MAEKLLGKIIAEYGTTNALSRARKKYPTYTVTGIKKESRMTWKVYGHKRKR